jgi:hypothetical protein
MQNLLRAIASLQCAPAHSDKADPAVQRNPLQALAKHTSNCSRLGSRGEVTLAGNYLEVSEFNFHADGCAATTFPF